MAWRHRSQMAGSKASTAVPASSPVSHVADVHLSRAVRVFRDACRAAAQQHSASPSVGGTAQQQQRAGVGAGDVFASPRSRFLCRSFVVAVVVVVACTFVCIAAVHGTGTPEASSHTTECGRDTMDTPLGLYPDSEMVMTMARTYVRSEPHPHPAMCEMRHFSPSRKLKA